MKKLMSMFAALAIVLGLGLASGQAAESKPIAALSVASYDDLIGNVTFVGSLVDMPQLATTVQGIVGIMTRNKGLAGVDTSRPLGAIVQMDPQSEGQVAVYVFLPVTDFDKALDLAKLYAKVEPEGDLFKVTPQQIPMPAFVKKVTNGRGTWAVIALRKELLADVAAEPIGLKKGYVIGGRIFLANMPAKFREKALGNLLHQLIGQAGMKQPRETDEEYASRKKELDKLEPYLDRVAGELNQITFGWGIDTAEKKTFLDLSVSALPDTKTAEEMGVAARSMTNFGGFHAENAAINAGIAGEISPANQEVASAVIEAGRANGIAKLEKDPKFNKEAFNNTCDLLQKIVKSGRADGAACVTITPDSLTAMAAGYVADGALMDKIVRALIADFVKENPKADVKFEAETVGDIHFHKIIAPPTNEDDKRMVPLVGDNTEIVIGIGKENVYVAAGRDAGARLKKAIAESNELGPKAVAPLHFSVAVKSVAEGIAVTGNPRDRDEAKMVAAQLEQAHGKDHVIMLVRPIKNGVEFHAEVEEGLLRLFGGLYVSKLNAGGPGGG